MKFPLMKKISTMVWRALGISLIMLEVMAWQALGINLIMLEVMAWRALGISLTMLDVTAWRALGTILAMLEVKARLLDGEEALPITSCRWWKGTTMDMTPHPTLDQPIKGMGVFLPRSETT